MTKAAFEWHGSLPDWLALLTGLAAACALCVVSILFLRWLENWHRTIENKPATYRLTALDWLGVGLVIAATVICAIVFLIMFIPMAIAALFVRDPRPKVEGHWAARTASLNSTLP